MDPKSLQPVFYNLQRFSESESLSENECKYVSDTLLHFRNNLSNSKGSANIFVDKESVAGIDTMQPDSSTFPRNLDSHLPKDRLLLNLFTLGFDRLLINLLIHAEKAKWITIIAELIALFYKDRNDVSEIEMLNFFSVNAEVSCKGDRSSNVSCPGQTSSKDQSQPTEREISFLKLLKQFTVNFLLRGYNTLVSQLHKHLLLQQEDFQNSKSDFIWFISYFLPFISQLKMNLNFFKDIFTIDILCYLIWESVHQTEEFEINSLKVPSVDLKLSQSRLHQSVVAILEYLRALEMHSRPSNKAKRKPLQELCGYLPAMCDLRQLFLLQLKQFIPNVQSRRYLCDVIKANHLLLLILERVSNNSERITSFNLQQHLNKFCTKTIIARYGTALEEFRTNESFVNDCIFTMLHHVGCDLREIALVCQPNILRYFAKIWEDSFHIADDWHDLIAYAFRNFSQSGGKADSEIVLPDEETQEFQNQEDLCLRTEKLTVLNQNGTNGHEIANPRIDFEALLILLKDIGFQKQVEWIQSTILTACAARLGIYSGHIFRHPITCLSLKLNVACPIVPWTEEEASALSSKPFRFFLRHLGLFPSTPDTLLYPRIPLEWSPDTLYGVALSLGPIVQQQVDFDLNCMRKLSTFPSIGTA